MTVSITKIILTGRISHVSHRVASQSSKLSKNTGFWLTYVIFADTKKCKNVHFAQKHKHMFNKPSVNQFVMQPRPKIQSERSGKNYQMFYNFLCRFQKSIFSNKLFLSVFFFVILT